MSALNALFKLTSLEQDVSRPGDLLIEIGTDAFDVSATTKEVTTQLTEILYAFLQIDNGVTADNENFLQTDKTITTSAVTVAREASGTNSAEFSFMFIGRKVA
jgi:hypothetical protein